MLVCLTVPSNQIREMSGRRFDCWVENDDSLVENDDSLVENDDSWVESDDSWVENGRAPSSCEVAPLRRPPRERKIRVQIPLTTVFSRGWVIPVTSKLALEWLRCQAPGVIGSVLG